MDCLFVLWITRKGDLHLRQEKQPSKEIANCDEIWKYLTEMLSKGEGGKYNEIEAYQGVRR